MVMKERADTMKEVLPYQQGLLSACRTNATNSVVKFAAIYPVEFNTKDESSKLIGAKRTYKTLYSYPLKEFKVECLQGNNKQETFQWLHSNDFLAPASQVETNFLCINQETYRCSSEEESQVKYWIDEVDIKSSKANSLMLRSKTIEQIGALNRETLETRSSSQAFLAMDSSKTSCNRCIDINGNAETNDNQLFDKLFEHRSHANLRSSLDDFKHNVNGMFRPISSRTPKTVSLMRVSSSGGKIERQEPMSKSESLIGNGRIGRRKIKRNLKIDIKSQIPLPKSSAQVNESMASQPSSELTHPKLSSATHAKSTHQQVTQATDTNTNYQACQLEANDQQANQSCQEQQAALALKLSELILREALQKAAPASAPAIETDTTLKVANFPPQLEVNINKADMSSSENEADQSSRSLGSQDINEGEKLQIRSFASLANLNQESSREIEEIQEQQISIDDSTSDNLNSSSHLDEGLGEAVNLVLKSSEALKDEDVKSDCTPNTTTGSASTLKDPVNIGDNTTIGSLNNFSVTSPESPSISISSSMLNLTEIPTASNQSLKEDYSSSSERNDSEPQQKDQSVVETDSELIVNDDIDMPDGQELNEHDVKKCHQLAGSLSSSKSDEDEVEEEEEEEDDGEEEREVYGANSEQESSSPDHMRFKFDFDDEQVHEGDDYGSIKLVRRTGSSASSNANCRRTLVCSLSPVSPLGGSNSDMSICNDLLNPNDTSSYFPYPIDEDEMLQCRAAFRENRRLIEEQQKRAVEAASQRPELQLALKSKSRISAKTIEGIKWKSPERKEQICSHCNKRLYPVDCMELDFTRAKLNIHRACFKCQVCSSLLRLETYAAMNTKLYCPTHIKSVTPSR